MLPRIADLTVNKYLSRENKSSRYLSKYRPNKVPWEITEPEIKRDNFFNSKKKRKKSVIKCDISLEDNTTSNITFSYFNNITNDTWTATTDISSTRLNTLNRNIVVNTTITTNTGSTIYTTSDNDLYYINLNEKCDVECDGIFDNGLNNKILSKSVLWNYQKDPMDKLRRKKEYVGSKIVPWSQKKLSIVEEMDYLDIEPGSIPWSKRTTGFDELVDVLKRSSFIPWRVEDEDMHALNLSRNGNHIILNTGIRELDGIINSVSDFSIIENERDLFVSA